MHFFGRFLILVLAPLLLCQAAWAKPAILDIRLGQHPGSTRIVVELSEATAYRVGLLAGPPGSTSSCLRRIGKAPACPVSWDR